MFKYVHSLLLVIFLLAGCASSPEREPSSTHLPPTHKQGKRETVLNTLHHMVGIRYQYGGNSPKGFDCSGLVWYSHKQAGISIPRTAREQMNRSNPVNRNNMRSGDLLFFKTGWGSNYHVATYIGGGLFIHAPSSGKKVSIARLDHPYWKQRLQRVGTFYPVR